MNVNGSEVNSLDHLTALCGIDVSQISDEKVEIEQAKMEKRRVEEFEIRKEEHFRKCGVGDRFLDITWEKVEIRSDEFEKNVLSVKEFISDVNRGKARTLWLLGCNGNGKTMLSALIAKDTLGTFRHMYNVEDDLKDAENFRNAENRSQVFERYKTYKVLILDEVGRNPDVNELRDLFHILNDRYDDKKSTVICSNLGKKELCQYLGKAIVDRFYENCSSLIFSDSSYRPIERERNVE